MTGHDPLAALDEAEPNLSPWEALARQARWLADYADRLARQEPADLAPTGDGDPLAELDTSANEIVSLVGGCRRATWQALRDDGLTYAEIGRMWGRRHSAVSNALTQQGRVR
ncbi:hypothetical protein [Nocardia asiatica]|uniref:hypothetical protein n=1 Tax=Nocardia asiatica TaxID=209252 RepID=UPI0024572A5E|nr:hypothetical protein [Nocardia asiatica]